MRSYLTQKSLYAFVAVIVFAPATAHAQQAGATLHQLHVGISKYPTQGALPYPHKDALDLGAFWHQQGKDRFAAVKGGVLIEENATTLNIVGNLDKIAREAKAGDWVVVSLAGHGGFVDNFQRRDREWYFVTWDTDERKFSETALSGATLRHKLTQLSERGITVILIVDSCHSGALTWTQTPYTVLAACQANQFSRDDHGYRNGLFTAVLFEALRGKADVNGDGRVTLAEINDYVVHHTNRQEHTMTPVTSRPQGVVDDLMLARLQDAVK